ncbi:hypothetical protein B0H10DRAFT_2213875 [Mycena sp. CBHHK59/15]|nr:hypothetical protein B0H10DRAFT_2213875 [Mycena sp. CBHHK59/15]
MPKTNMMCACCAHVAQATTLAAVTMNLSALANPTYPQSVGLWLDDYPSPFPFDVIVHGTFMDMGETMLALSILSPSNF